ncbi:MAG: FAD-dependent oxidoreductase [Pyrinomonadaceae bacterium]
MDYEVIVIGGGIGGLTAAALLAARGVQVGLFERASQVGGCVTLVESSAHRFDPGAGLFAGWGADEIHQRVFVELGMAPPPARLLDAPYSVRLPDGREVLRRADRTAFESELAAAFPECAEATIAFYRALEPIGAALDRAVRHQPALATSTRWLRAKLIAAEPRISARILAAMQHTTAYYLTGTSIRFRRFIDAQLQLFGLCGSDECAYLYAAVALALPARGLYSLDGGGAALADSLALAIKKPGGEIHCGQTVLRLVFGSDGKAVGVDLLSGERVTASRAVVSDLTAADSYGKLVGWDRTPAEIRQRIQGAADWGCYQMFLSAGLREVERLPSSRILALTDWQLDESFAPDQSWFMLSAGDAGGAPEGRRAITVSAFCETAPWFDYQRDGDQHEALDQAALERWWTLVLGAVPEIADGLEVIATATPRTYYEDTRRKLGSVGGLGQSLAVFGPNALTHRTPVPGLYLVGDSVFPGNGLAAVTLSGLIAANEICPR